VPRGVRRMKERPHVASPTGCPGRVVRRREGFRHRP
jgi:hypothetical protein